MPETVSNINTLQPKTIPLNVKLSKDDKNRLEDLAARTGMSMGFVVRSAVHNMWAMVCAQQPVCSNGQQCSVPQVHATTRISEHSAIVPQNRNPVDTEHTISTPQKGV